MMDLFPNAPMNKRASDNLRNLATINLFDRYTIAKSMMMSFSSEGCLLTPRLSWFYASHQALLHIITCSMGQHFVMMH